ncbi:MAG TPA: PAS domain S-box protein, partial [Puia sp.]|nr:PAS domain S-box protein [Puia sp.]
MNSPTGYKLVYGIVIALAGVLGIGILSILQYGRMQEGWAILRHTNEVLFGIRDIETARDRSVYLDRIGYVKALTVDNAVQQRRIDSLLAGGDRKLLLSRMEDEERRLLDRRREDMQRRASELQWILWALIAAVLVLTFILFRKIRLDLRRQTSHLQSTEEKYKTLFYKSPLPKWIYDEDTLRFLEVNDTAIREYGYTREEFLSMTIADIRPPEDVDKLKQTARQVRQLGQVFADSRWRHVKKDGQRINVEITSHPIEFEGRRARMVVVNDVTAQRQHEEQLGRLNADLTRRAAELAASNSELERFAYIASHDLQEPLRMVSSFLQLLQKRYGSQLDTRAHQYIHFAVDGAERMKTLIMDLLEYSRVGSGRQDFTDVDVAVVLKEVGDIFRHRVMAAGARLEFGPMPVVWGDRVQLVQLFQNLVSNALKYHSDQPPVIGIRASEQPAYWQFAVEDNGIGID